MSNEQPQVPAETVDKEIKLGEIGKVEIDFKDGMAHVSVSAEAPGGLGVSAGAFVKCDSAALIHKIFDAIRAKTPDALDKLADGAELIIVNAVKAL